MALVIMSNSRQHWFIKQFKERYLLQRQVESQKYLIKYGFPTAVPYLVDYTNLTVYFDFIETNSDNLSDSIDVIYHQSTSLLVQLHTIPPPVNLFGDYFVNDRTLFSTLQESLYSRAKDSFEQLGRLNLDCRTKVHKWNDEIFYLIESTEFPEIPSIVHRDFRRENIIVVKKQLYLIDFERANLSDNIEDFPKVYLAIANEAIFLSWIKKYLQMTNVLRDSVDRKFLFMRLKLFTIMEILGTLIYNRLFTSYQIKTRLKSLESLINICDNFINRTA